jgi:hypothetical protein
MIRATQLALSIALASSFLPGLAAAQAPFTFEERDGRLVLLEGTQPVFAYNHQPQLPPGVPPAYRRSTYIHPLWDLSGRVITDDFPADHYHHRGVSWMWPRVAVGGTEYDLWHLRGIRQTFDRWLAREVDASGATLGVKNSWTVGDRVVMDEEVWIRAHRANEKGRAIDVRLVLTAREPVQIRGTEEGNKGYGGFVLRLAPREDTRITTADGLQTQDSDHLTPVWADGSGRFAGSDEFSGVAIFQHRDNPGFPAAWTLRHYGFVGNAWPSLGEFRFEPGKPVTLRYRIWVHRGDAQVGGVAEAYRQYDGAALPSAAN